MAFEVYLQLKEVDSEYVYNEVALCLSALKKFM